MDWLKNLPVSRKFTFAFGVVCGLCILLGGYTFVTFHSIAAKSVDVSDNSFPSVVVLAELQGAANTIRREDLELLLCQTPACSTDHGAKRQKGLDTYLAGVKRYEPMVSYPGERELYQKFSTAFNQYIDASNRAA
jgi:methyl-accepting chemotaxis protein